MVTVGTQVDRNTVRSRGTDTDLNLHGSTGAVQQGDTIERSGVTDTGDFVLQGGVLSIEVTAIRVGQRAVQGLFGQFLHAQQNARRLVHRAFSGLDHRDAVRSVPGRLSQSTDVRFQAFTDGQASSVITSAVDTQTRAQLFHAFLERGGGLRQVALRVE